MVGKDHAIGGRDAQGVGEGRGSPGSRKRKPTEPTVTVLKTKKGLKIRETSTASRW